MFPFFDYCLVLLAAHCKQIAGAFAAGRPVAAIVAIPAALYSIHLQVQHQQLGVLYRCWERHSGKKWQPTGAGCPASAWLPLQMWQAGCG